MEVVHTLADRWIISGVFVVSYVVYLAISAVRSAYFHPLSKVPGPKLNAAFRIPYVIHLFTGDGHHYARRLHEKYGDRVRVSPTQISYNNAQSFRDIYGARIGNYDLNPKDPKNYGNPANGVAWILSNTGDDHVRVRRAFSPAFSEKALRDQEDLFQKYADQLMAALRNLSSRPINMVDWFNYATFDIMSDLTFGDSLHLLDGPPENPWRDWVNAQFVDIKALAGMVALKQWDFLGELIPYLIPKSIMDKHHESHNRAAEKVDRRVATKTDRPDIWTQVLREQGEKGLSKEEMHSNAVLFMMAGTETTATSLAATTYYLLKNPDKLQKLTREVRSAFKTDEQINFDALLRLPYLHACLEEGLRIHPAAPSAQQRLTPPGGSTICGEWVPGGTTIGTHHFATFHSAKHFERPDDFIPERWLPGSPFDDNKAAFQPFQVGRRNCIGQSMAYHEMRLLLAKLLWHFDLVGLNDESRRWNEQRVFILWEKGPLMVRMREREVAVDEEGEQEKKGEGEGKGETEVEGDEQEESFVKVEKKEEEEEEQEEGKGEEDTIEVVPLPKPLPKALPLPAIKEEKEKEQQEKEKKEKTKKSASISSQVVAQQHQQDQQHQQPKEETAHGPPAPAPAPVTEDAKEQQQENTELSSQSLPVIAEEKETEKETEKSESESIPLTEEEKRELTQAVPVPVQVPAQVMGNATATATATTATTTARA